MVETLHCARHGSDHDTGRRLTKTKSGPDKILPKSTKNKRDRNSLGSEASTEIKIYSVDNIKLIPRTAFSCTARLAPTEQPKETIHQVIPTEEVIPGDEEVVLVESVVRKNGKGKIPVMLANLGNKTVKVPKGEKLGNISPLSIRKQVKYIEKGTTKIRKVRSIHRTSIYQTNIERKIDLIQKNRDVIANSDKELGRTRAVQMKIDTGNNPQ